MSYLRDEEAAFHGEYASRRTIEARQGPNDQGRLASECSVWRYSCYLSPSIDAVTASAMLEGPIIDRMRLMFETAGKVCREPSHPPYLKKAAVTFLEKATDLVERGAFKVHGIEDMSPIVEPYID